MGIFSTAQVDQINKIAAKSTEAIEMAKPVNAKSVNSELQEMEAQVAEYFKDSPAILINNAVELHDYVTKCIEHGYAGIDTETTGLDRVHDYVVGASLYCPGQPECYIPMRHRIPIFEQPYKDQLTYAEVKVEFDRFVEAKTRLVFANADFDLAMIYRWIGSDLVDVCYYDCILAWRCLKEDELDNTLKGLYAKYPMRGKVDPKKFSDFFSPKLFPYCKPEIAKLYAANDAKITFELMLWQLPYITKSHAKCQKAHLEKIADLIWNVEFPMIKVCAMLHRTGIYLDDSVAKPLHVRYQARLDKDTKELGQLVQELIDTKDTPYNKSRPFKTGADFNPNSTPHVKYLVVSLLGKEVSSTDKQVLEEINMPVTNQILKVRGDVKLLSTYVDKLPGVIDAKDDRVHGSFKSIGASTGRMSSEAPNMQNIPSHALDIRHMFRATPHRDELVQVKDDTIMLSKRDSIETSAGWKYAADLEVTDVLITSDSDKCVSISHIFIDDATNNYVVKIQKGEL